MRVSTKSAASVMTILLTGNYPFNSSSGIKSAASVPSYSTSTVKDDINMGKSKTKTTHLENLIRIKCKSGSLKLDEALGFFNHMIQMPPREMPSIWAFNQLVGVLSKMKHFAAVVSLCKEMMGC